MSDRSMMDQLDKDIEALLTGARQETAASDPLVAELLAIAAELRTLPSAEFKATLKADLLEQAARSTGIGIRGGSSRIAPLQVRATDDATIPSEILPTLVGAGNGLYPIRRASFMASLGTHAAAVALIVTSGIWAAQSVREVPRVSSSLLTEVSPYVLPAAADKTGGGGGGGDRDKSQAPKGNPPKFSREQITPPAVVVRNEEPKLQAEPTVVGPPNVTFPKTATGDPLSGVIGSPSNGPGSGGGFGSGSGGGVGIGTGPGIGPGEGGGFGGGIYRVGGGVRAPRAIYDPEPEYSDEARKAKYQGSMLLQVVVGADGRPRDVRVARSLGMGLDEKALEAIRKWRFDPATKDGQPVAVMVNIEVNFRLY